MMCVDQKVEIGKYRAMDISLPKVLHPITLRGWLKLAWGSDVWVWGVPVLKTLVLCNALVWVILVVAVR